MSDESSSAGRHLSQIETLWPVLVAANDGTEGARAAQSAILQRYRPAVYRYLRACLGDADAAEDVWQDFSVRFLRGDFRNANPEKGRFRDLLKTAIYHLVLDHHKKRKRRLPNYSPEAPEPADEASPMPGPDEGFARAWRDELLNRCWESLAADERKSGRPMHTVLRLRASQPDARSHEMAAALTKQMGKAITADWVRKWLHLARERFAEVLLREVAATLKDPGPDAVEEELIDLELHAYCKEAVDKWRKGLAPGA
jgi:RNA polymerase sigma-70 factor (ECF subfamily)